MIKRTMLLLTAASGMVNAGAQQLLINEVSQGASGSREYIELVVSGTRTCTDSTLNIGGIILDDNPGWYGQEGVGTGCIRFAPVAGWAKVKYGSVILIYNASDKNTSITQADDPTDANNDLVYIVPSNSPLLQVATLPSGASPSFNYSSITNWTATTLTSWSNALTLTNGADAVHLVVPAVSTVAASHSLSYGALTGGVQPAQLQFPTVSGAQKVYLHQGNNAAVQSQWTTGVVPAAETPGAGNSIANAAWIAAMRVQQPAVPPQPGVISGPAAVCAGSIATYSVAPVPGATSYTWSLPAGWSGGTSGPSVSMTPGSSGGVVGVVAGNVCGASAPANRTITVNSPAPPSVSLTVSPGETVCAGVPVALSAIPGPTVVGPVYTWLRNGLPVGQGASFISNNHSNGDVFAVSMTSGSLCAGNATVLSTNAVTLTVLPPVTPGVNVNAFPATTLCPGMPVTFITNIAAGGSNPQYQWYRNGNAIPGATAPTYTDTVPANNDTVAVVLTSDELCALPQAMPSNRVGLTVLPLVTPTVGILVSPGMPIAPGTAVDFTAGIIGGGANPGLQWYINGSPVSGATGFTYSCGTMQNNDAITVRLHSSAPCAVQSLVVSPAVIMQHTLTVAGNVSEAEMRMQLFPNPNNGRFYIRVSRQFFQPDEEVLLEVFDVVGRRLRERRLRQVKAELVVQIGMDSRLADGKYVLRLSSKKATISLPFVVSP